jgi:hypothetical protein
MKKLHMLLLELLPFLFDSGDQFRKRNAQAISEHLNDQYGWIALG